MKLELISISKPSYWRNALEAAGGGDIYCDPAYISFLARRGEGEPRMLIVKHENNIGVHVFFLRPISELEIATTKEKGLYDAASPLGYAGPFLSHTDSDFVDKFFNAWLDTMPKLGVVSELVRFHPVFANHKIFLHKIDIEVIGRSILVDLTSDVEMAATPEWRKKVTAARRKQIAFENVETKSWLNKFAKFYHSYVTMIGADEYYLFDEKYFKELADSLGDRLILTRAHRHGVTAAIGMFFHYRQLMHFHLGAINPELTPSRPMDLLLWGSALLGRSLGCTCLHLGGNQDEKIGFGLRFKSAISSWHKEVAIGKIVHNVDAYIRLCRTAGLDKGIPAQAGHFPPYRSYLKSK